MNCLAEENGQYCLTPTEWTSGQCCDITDFTTPECDSVPIEEFDAFCARKTTIANR
jgi:hypothetical protein